MKQGKRNKQKLDPAVGFETDKDKHSAPVQTVDHPYFMRPGEGHLACEQTSPRSQHTRDDAEKRLKECGISQIERHIVIARKFDRKSFRTIGAELGKSGTWVQKIMRRIEPLLRVPTVQADTRQQNELPPVPLETAMENARKALDNYRFLDMPDIGHMASGLAELNLSDKAVAAIALWPRLLSHPNIGSVLAAKVGGLLFVAHYGSKVEAKAARKTLAPLTHYRQGNRCPIPDFVLASEALPICVTLTELQRAWNERSNERSTETKDAKVDAVRDRFPGVMNGFTNQELMRVMQSDLVRASARLAEKATGLAAETFVRAWRSKTLEGEIQFLKQRARP